METQHCREVAKVTCFMLPHHENSLGKYVFEYCCTSRIYCPCEQKHKVYVEVCSFGRTETNGPLHVEEVLVLFVTLAAIQIDR